MKVPQYCDRHGTTTVVKQSDDIGWHEVEKARDLGLIPFDGAQIWK